MNAGSPNLKAGAPISAAKNPPLHSTANPLKINQDESTPKSDRRAKRLTGRETKIELFTIQPVKTKNPVYSFPLPLLLLQVWSHVYGRDNLNVAPEDHAVLLTEAPLNPYKNRRQCAETFFENFGVPAMFCAPQV